MKVVETETNWLINCPACKWHEIPKVGKPGATWVFNGDFQNPTFTPSVNYSVNQPGPNHRPTIPSIRCHFIVTNGKISFCGDCTHSFAGQVLDLPDFSDSQILYYKNI